MNRNRKLNRFDRFRDEHEKQEDIFWLILLAALVVYVITAAFE
jgi:hypothetical protein